MNSGESPIPVGSEGESEPRGFFQKKVRRFRKLTRLQLISIGLPAFFLGFLLFFASGLVFPNVPQRFIAQNDFVAGGLLGAGIGLILLSVALNAFAIRARAN